MSVLVLGAGQLGRALAERACPNGPEVRLLSRAELDVTDRPALEAAIAEQPWQAVVNATAYTAVDRAESEPEAAAAVNAEAVAGMAEACAARDLPLIHVSTDYVFDGKATRPYRENDPTNPQGVYGTTKLAGEEALRTLWPKHVILRTSWLYSAGGRNFLTTMLRLAEEREELQIVDDQQGCPTTAAGLGDAIHVLCRRIAAGEEMDWGLYHYCGTGPITWHRFAEAIFEAAGAYGHPRPTVLPTTTEAFGAPAPRPAYSALDCAKIARDYGIGQEDWQDALGETVEEFFSARDRQAAGGEQ